MKRPLIAAMLVGASASCLADCPAPLPRDLPVIPTGSAVTAQVMAQAGEEVRSYVRGIEAFLRCRDSLNPLHYNHLVEKAETVASAYNDELASFFGNDDMLANK